jgi:hypothetical protein
MRWKLLALGLPIAVAGLLYGGGIAFLSSLSNAVAPRGAHGSGTAAVTAVRAPAPSDHGPASPMVAIDALTLAPASHPDASPLPEGSSPEASEQRVLQSRRALETVDPKELVRQGGLSK